MAQEFVCDVLQRYFAKRMLRNYKYMRELTLSIANEMGTNVQMVELILRQNGVDC